MSQQHQEQQSPSKNNEILCRDQIVVIGHCDTGKTEIVKTLMRNLNLKQAVGSWKGDVTFEVCQKDSYHFWKELDYPLSTPRPKTFHFASTNVQNLNLTNLNTRMSSSPKEEKAEEKNKNNDDDDYKNDTEEEQEQEKKEDLSFLFSIIDQSSHRKSFRQRTRSYAGATIGVLVVSAKSSEFEASMSTFRQNFGGTKMVPALGSATGIHRWVVVINKMDEATPRNAYDEARYREIVEEVLKTMTVYCLPKRILFVPACARTGLNVFPSKENEKEMKEKMPWYLDHPLIPDNNSIKDTSGKNAKSTAPPLVNKLADEIKHIPITLLEALQFQSVENYKSNTKPIKAGSLYIPNKYASEKEAEKKANRLLPALEQKSLPLRIMVLRAFPKHHIPQIVRRNSESLMKDDTSTLIKVVDLVLVKVVCGRVTIGDLLVFEPGHIIRKVVSIGHDEIAGTVDSPTTETVVTYLSEMKMMKTEEKNENENTDQKMTSLTRTRCDRVDFSNDFFVEGPASIVVLGLAEAPENEKAQLEAARYRSQELEFTNVEETSAAASSSFADKYKRQNLIHPKFKKQYDVIMGWSKKTHGLIRPKSLSKQQVQEASEKFFKSLQIVTGCVAGHFLHPDAPRVYFAQNEGDSFFGQVKFMKPKTLDGFETGFSPVIDVGSQRVSCHIEFIHEIDKRTGKDIELKEGEKPKTKFTRYEMAFVKFTPVYPHRPIIIDPLFAEGRGSNSKTILGRLICFENEAFCMVSAIRSMWVLRKWPFLIRFFGKGKAAEAFQIWNVVVKVALFLSWKR